MITKELFKPFAAPIPEVKVTGLKPIGATNYAPITDRYIINFMVQSQKAKSSVLHEHIINDLFSPAQHYELIQRFMNSVGKQYTHELINIIADGFDDEDIIWNMECALEDLADDATLTKVYVKYYDMWGRIVDVDVQTEPKEQL